MKEAERAQQTGQAAKEQASATAGQAAQAAGDVTSTAAEQAKAVAGEAEAQAGTAIRELRDRVRSEAQGQTERMSGTVREWADDLDGLAQNAPGDSPARNLVAQTADGGRRAADYLDKNGVDGLLGDLQQFARRRPGAFLGGAVVAGLVAGRLAKAGKGARSTDSDESRAVPRREETPLRRGAARSELPGSAGSEA